MFSSFLLPNFFVFLFYFLVDFLNLFFNSPIEFFFSVLFVISMSLSFSLNALSLSLKSIREHSISFYFNMKVLFCFFPFLGFSLFLPSFPPFFLICLFWSVFGLSLMLEDSLKYLMVLDGWFTVISEALKIYL